MFGLGNLLGDVVKIVAAPVQVVASVARVVTAPVADVAQEIAKDIDTTVRDMTDKGGW